MNKINAINSLISCVYNDGRKNVLTKKEIIHIEQYFKNNYQLYADLDSFCKSNAAIKKSIDKLKSGKCEIEKQIKCQKALQRGIISECVFVQTLANILGLNKFYDLENDSVANIPKEVKSNLGKVRDKAKTGCAARYVYYKKDSYDDILFQYGNPAAIGDATAILFSNEIIIEIKDMPALLEDKDLEYDENGHLIITDDIRTKFSDYIMPINDFNANTTVFEEFGHNYKIFSNANIEVKQQFITSYIGSTSMDVLMTSYEDKLIIIKKDDLVKPLSNGELILTTEGSEIRTTGKNSKKVFTPDYLKNTLKSLDITIDKNGICSVLKTNSKIIGFIQGRGTTDITRFKITNCFYVKNDRNKLINCNDHWEFKFSDILQCKSGISIHISLSKNKAEIKKELGY